MTKQPTPPQPGDISLKQVVEEFSKQFGKTLNDVQDVKMNDNHTEFLVLYKDGTHALIEADYSNIEKH